MKFRQLAPVVGFLLAAGCADLEVENPNEPNTERVLAAPEDVVSLIGSSYSTWWSAHHASFNSAGSALSVAADAHSSSWGNFYMREISSEPRQALTNSTSHAYAAVLEHPWYRDYAALKAANDGLRAINSGVKLGANEAMAKAFAKFVQGISHGQIALIYDQGFIFDETVGPEQVIAGLPLKSHKEVMAAAIKQLQEAASIASSNSFTTPTGWINGVTLTSAELAQLANSYIARFTAGVARTPAERAAVNWNAVIAAADKGITRDFAPKGEQGFFNTQWWDVMKTYGGGYATWARMDMRFYGMADVSGEYQKWMGTPVASRDAFLITTPDRRITGPTPTSHGTHVRYAGRSPFLAARGTYHHSLYSDNRWMDYMNDPSQAMPEFMVREVRLLKAEGLMRTGRNAEAAAIINETRVRAGLPPVTAAGVPSAPNCVPHEPSATKQCGSLLRALHWEKWVETYHTGVPTEFTDARGWGFLVPGTPLHFPVPAKELQVLQLPIYTFGGEGKPGSAGSLSAPDFGSLDRAGGFGVPDAIMNAPAAPVRDGNREPARQ